MRPWPSSLPPDPRAPGLAGADDAGPSADRDARDRRASRVRGDRAESGGRSLFTDFVAGWILVLAPDDPRRPVSASPFAPVRARPVAPRFAPDGARPVLTGDARFRDDRFEPGTGGLRRL